MSPHQQSRIRNTGVPLDLLKVGCACGVGGMWGEVEWVFAAGGGVG